MAALIREYEIALERPGAEPVRLRQRGYDGADAAAIARVFYPQHLITAIEPVPPETAFREEARRAP